MSKLADAIRRSQRVEAGPIGFGAARPAPKPSMLTGYAGLLAGAAAAHAAGAEVVLVDARAGGLAAADVKKLRGQAGDSPLGAWASVADAEAAKSLREAGLDFLVVEADSTPASVLLDDQLGYVLALTGPFDEHFLRSLEPLAFEALLLTEPPDTLTVARQIELTRVSALARKPLLAFAEPGITGDDLQCLRAAGIVGVLVSEDAVSAVKERVAALPPRRGRRDERAVVSLPRGPVAAAADEDDDDDD